MQQPAPSSTIPTEATEAAAAAVVEPETGKALLPRAALSRSLVRRLTQWMCNISVERLQFYTIAFQNLDPWKTLADLLHVKPTMMQDPTFLPLAFGLGNAANPLSRAINSLT